MKRNIFILLIIASILIVFSTLIFASETIDVEDYIKDKFPSVFSFYLSSLEELDQYEKEFIDLLEKLPKEEQEYYAKEVYKNSFSLELLKSIKEGKTIKVPASTPTLPSLPAHKENPIESLPSLIKRIKPSVVIVFAYDNKGEFLQLGSGFFISQGGDIITNYHVLQGASSAEVKTSEGKTYPITYIVAGDEQSDIIRLSVDIPSKYVRPLSLTETIPEVGERIIVYGSPLGLEKTASDGIISAIREVPGYGKLIQITAPISPGSSGSPVLNMKGEVIGVATFQMIEGQNLNFAIPSERIVRLELTKEKKTSITEELFEQEEKDKKDSDYAYEAYNKALYFIDKREHEKALPYLEIAIKTDISSLKAWAYFQIGFCYGELKSYAKAIEAYKQAIRIDPDDVAAHHNLGYAYGQLGFHKDAIEAYKQAIRIDPDFAKAHCKLGVAYYKLGLYKNAIEAYKQALRIDPDDADAHCNLGATYGQLGFYKDAIEAFKQALRIDPDHAETHFGLGVAYYKLGLYKDAIEAFKQALRINPDDADAHCNLGLAYDELGFYKDAIEAFKQAIRIDPDHARAYHNLGATYGKLGLYKDAIEAFKWAIHINPDYTKAHYNLGFTYFLIGDRNSALNEYKILKELDIDLANKLFDLIY